jgi:hypothetical protein
MTFVKRACLVLLFSLVSVALGPAAHAGGTSGTRRIAIVVGANAPPPGRPALRFAQDDARELADTLERVGGFAPSDVSVLLDPTPAEVLAAFDRTAATAAGLGGEVLFLFYYSGHSDGQLLFPHGEPLALGDLRTRVEHLGARIRIGILDTCRGGSWTQAKGLSVGPPLKMADLMNVDTEGTALVSSSSGLENAHEAAEVRGSFFTHYLNAGLRGAADRAGDGTVTLEEAFDYAKERTVRDSARIATTPQHPSFDLALRGRRDIVLTAFTSSTSALQVENNHASLEVIHLQSGVTVADAPDGQSTVHIALPPGRYLVRSVVDGKVYAKEVEVKNGETATLSSGQLEATGQGQLALKGADDDGDVMTVHLGLGSRDENDEPSRPAPPTAGEAGEDKKKTPRSWRFPHCNDPEPDATSTIHMTDGCSGIFGIRGSLVDTSGVADQHRAGLQVAASAEEYWHGRITSSLLRYDLGIGGGGAGFEGALGGTYTYGLRVPVLEHQGPVLRAGIQAYMMGNDAFYSSLLELPQLNGGWQWSRGNAVIEAAATSGVALTGRFRAGASETRELAGFAYGGHLSVQVPWVRLSAVAERLPANDGQGPVDMATGSLCLVTSPIALCADARGQQGDARLANVEQQVRAFYGGITLGFTGGP